MERSYKTLEAECIRLRTPISLAGARRIVEDFVAHDNGVRLHSAIGDVATADKRTGDDRQIVAERDRKQDATRERRKAARAASRAGTATDPGPPRARPRGRRENERGPGGVHLIARPRFLHFTRNQHSLRSPRLL